MYLSQWQNYTISHNLVSKQERGSAFPYYMMNSCRHLDFSKTLISKRSTIFPNASLKISYALVCSEIADLIFHSGNRAIGIVVLFSLPVFPKRT